MGGAGVVALSWKGGMAGDCGFVFWSGEFERPVFLWKKIFWSVEIVFVGMIAPLFLRECLMGTESPVLRV